MQTEIIPLCLRIMKRGQELSRTVATFIVQKILVDENGLTYICQTGERFYAVSRELYSERSIRQEKPRTAQTLAGTVNNTLKKYTYSFKLFTYNKTNTAY